jgi:uncharacterized protein (DUF488 family)
LSREQDSIDKPLFHGTMPADLSLEPDVFMRKDRKQLLARRTSAAVSPRLLTRQRELLRLLDALGGSVGNRDFQKLLLLYCEEPMSDRPYDFVPYKYGAFSFTSYADRRKLIERGLLVDDEHHWRLTDEGLDAIGGTSDMQVAAFVRQHGSQRGDALVAETYRRFPYYATRSQIAERVLSRDQDALRRIEAARPKAPARALHTIGYEGHTLESYLNSLLRAGVTVLCDVRRNPISRKYGFSKGALSRACERLGIRYEHSPKLGIASERRRGLDSQEDYDALFADYERKWLPKQTESLGRIREWTRAGGCVALTCYEHSPQQCHRHCVAEVLEVQLGSDAKHL